MQIAPRSHEKNRLDPMLQQISSSPMDRHKTVEFFETSKVVEKIDACKIYLFEFMDADHGEDEAMASLGLKWCVCLGTGIVTIDMTGACE